MEDLETRIQNAIDEITGNEALLEMLDEEAAAEMQEWGTFMAVSLVKEFAGEETPDRQQALASRLKAVRQFMRSAGNWAAGKYTGPENRAQLRDKLLDQYRLIAGKDKGLPSTDHLEAVLNQVDDKEKTQGQLILSLKNLLNGPR